MDPRVVVDEFAVRLSHLRDFPDKTVILDLTRFAEIHISLGAQLCHVIIARLMDPATNITYKLPLFYLVDSIIKHVGGHYPVLFSRYMSEAFMRSFNEVPDKDQSKLDFLLGTWEERKLMTLDFLTRLRAHVNLVNKQKGRSIGFPPSSHQQGNHHGSHHGGQHVQHGTQHVNQLVSHPTEGPSLGGSSAKRGREDNIALDAPFKQQFRPGPEAASFPSYNDIVHLEMEKLLMQMYEDMNVTDNRLSLQDLRELNPSLFDQIKFTACSMADAAMQRFAAQQHTVPLSSQLLPPGNMTSVNSRGRVAPAPASSMSTGAPRGPLEVMRQPVLSGATTGGRPILSSTTEHISAPSSEGLHRLPVQEYRKPNLVHAFIAEAPVTLNVTRIGALLERVIDTALPDGLVSNEKLLNENHVLLADKLKYFLDTIHIPPPLPSILLGPLPLDVSKEYFAREAATSAARIAANAPPAALKPKREMPKFRASELDRPVIKGIRSMYDDLPHQYGEDGVRFKTLVDLAKHTDAYLAKKDSIRKKELSGEKIFRLWYCSSSQWVTDFNARGGKSQADAAEPGPATGAEQSSEVFIVPADEHFVRCPVSKEVFETVWDEDEGEYMYRNAVKVLVTAAADPALYAVGLPTESEPEIHYLIVHKLLVLDGWLQQGRADSLKNTKQRYSQMLGAFRGADKCQLLASAADDEDEEDVFVVLELA